MNPGDGEAQPVTSRRPWGAVLVVLAGTLMVTVDATIMNVALPRMATDLNTGEAIEWVVTAYLLALGVAQAPTGWLADRFGTREVFLSAIALFALASAAVAGAPNLTLVVAARVAQGLAGGVTVPLGTALIFRLFPAGRRGRAVGMAGTASMLAPAIGPVLAGYVVTNASWRWLLIVNLPIGLVASVVGLRLIPRADDRRPRSLDVAGLTLVGLGLVALLVASSQASAWGVGSIRFVAAFSSGVALLTAFIRRSLKVDEPVLDLSVFRSRSFALSMGFVAALSTPQFARNVFVPIELQTLMGFSPLTAGLVLGTAGLVGAVMMPVAGTWADHRGGREPIVLGFVIAAVATFLIANADPQTPVASLVIVVGLSGMATVLVTLPTTVVSLSAIREDLVPQGAAIRFLTRQVSASLSTAVLATVIVARGGALNPENASRTTLESASDAYTFGYLIAVGMALLGLILSLFLPSDLASRADPSGAEAGSEHTSSSAVAPE